MLDYIHYSIFQVCVVLMFRRATVQYSLVLHIVICMRSMAEVGSSTSSPGVSVHEWLDIDSKESVNDKERTTKTW